VASETRITPDRAVLVGAILAALAYIQDVRYDFILDDVPLILTNDTITSWRNWKLAFVTHIFEDKGPSFSIEAAAVHYRPVYKLWQMLNEQLFGSVLPWWHITSLLLHIAAVFLVYQLGIKLLKERWTAALAAVLFAFHPIHAESVAYVTASTDLLVTVFALLAFLMYFHFREEGGSPVYLVVSVVMAALAMMSKETAAMFPWVLVAYEALRQASSGTSTKSPSWAARLWNQFAWTLPFFAVVGAYLAVRTYLFGPKAGGGAGGNRLAALLDIPLVLDVYLRNFFWPFRLSFFYPGEWGSQWTLWRGIAAVGVIVSAGVLWIRYRDRSGIRLQLLWSAILFAPALLGVYMFVREDWVHDRHMYLVSVPICLIAAALLTDARWPKKASIIASSVILAVLLADLAFQVPRFSDDNTIYESALKVAPHSLLAHSYYAVALWAYGNTDAGLREFRIATELAPRSANAHEGYGAALAMLHRDDEAKVEYQRALDLYTKPARFRGFLLSEIAQLELKDSEFPEAAAHMREAVRIAPQTLNYHSLLAQALSRQGQTKEADEQMRLEAVIRQQALKEENASRD
jgi:tetratricopeptide (TPR) repeat protein